LEGLGGVLATAAQTVLRWLPFMRHDSCADGAATAADAAAGGDMPCGNGADGTVRLPPPATLQAAGTDDDDGSNKAGEPRRKDD
jgi:hypothetical protein